MFLFLKLIPIKDWLYGGIIVAILLGSWWFVDHVEAIGARKAEAQLTAEHEHNAALRVIAEAQAKAETDRQTAINKDVDRETARLNQVSTLAARASADSDIRLRNRLILAAAARVPEAPVSAPSVSVIPDPAPSVPWDVFARLDDAAGQLAVFSDGLTIALGECTGRYNALIPPSASSPASSPALQGATP